MDQIEVVAVVLDAGFAAADENRHSSGGFIESQADLFLRFLREAGQDESSQTEEESDRARRASAPGGQTVHGSRCG